MFPKAMGEALNFAEGHNNCCTTSSRKRIKDCQMEIESRSTDCCGSQGVHDIEFATRHTLSSTDRTHAARYRFDDSATSAIGRCVRQHLKLGLLIYINHKMA
jgi:hypothetical protein